LNRFTNDGSGSSPASRWRRAARWLLLLLALPQLAWAGQQAHHFRTLDSRDGLSQNTVNALLQSQRGFVWIATEGGLHRHDGVRLRYLQHDPDDPRSLPDSFITALAEDDADNLWIGTNAHYVASLDLRTGDIKHHLQARASDEVPGVNRVNALLHQPGVGLWVATARGIDLYKPESGLRESRLSFSAEPSSAQDTDGMALLADGSLLAATHEGLFLFSAEQGLPRRIGGELPTHSVLADGENSAWVGGDDGLYRWERDAGGLRRVWPANGASEPVRALARDLQGNLWLALYRGGLARFSPGESEPLRIRHDPDLDRGLHEERLSTLLVDRSGLLWVGGKVRGIATTRPEGSAFSRVLTTRPELQPVLANNLRAVHQDPDGVLWLGSEGRGLIRLRGENLQFESHYEPLRAARPGLAADASIRVLGIADGEPGRLWLTSDRGLFDYQPSERRALRVELPLRPGRAQPVTDLRELLKVQDGSLWIATYSDGLLQLDRERGTHRWFHPEPGNPASLSHALVTDVFQDRDGAIWASTLNGLNRIDPVSGEVRRFLNQPNDANSLSGNLVRHVSQDATGALWVSTHSGLDRLEFSDDGQVQIRRFGVAQGLGSPTVYAAIADAEGQIWLSSNSGLAKLDPIKGTLLRYDLADGLQDLEFNGAVAEVLADGRMAFGGVRGLNLFDPLQIRSSRFDAPVHLLQIHVGRGQQSLSGLRMPQRIEVAQAERFLRFEFAALDYSFPERNRFSYQLEGFDLDWVQADHRSEATYTNLAAGSYRLRVRGTNRDGHVSADEATLEVVIVPPWWLSNLALVVYTLLLVALAAVLVKRYLSKRASQQRLLDELSQRGERLKLSLWGSGDEFWDWDIRSNRIYRVGAEQLLGPGADSEVDTDDFRSRAVHPEDIARLQQIMQAHVAGRTEFFESEHRVRRSDGAWVWVRSRGKVVERDSAGSPIRMAGTARDITASREFERDRRIASEVLRSMGESVAVCDLQMRFVSVNPAFTQITGYTLDDIETQPVALLESSQHDAAFYRQMRDTVVATGQWHGEMWQRRKDGDEFLASVEANAVLDSQGERSHYVWVASDITDRKRAEQELRYLANYDTLTGLPNRSMLSERLARAVVRARRQGTRVAVLFLDLDRFKDINDSLGHAAGDRILKSAAARLLATVRPHDTVARLGGDEFTVVLEELDDRDSVEEVAQRIIKAFIAPLEVEGHSEIIITPSIGISLYPDHALVPTDLLKYSDTAMYAAKDRGRNTYAFYNEVMDAEARRRALLVAALRRALDRREFYLVFQPRLSLSDGRVAGFEALLRWRSEELGDMSPAEFIPVAEETGLILSIGDWVLREAMSVLAGWHEGGRPELAMSINVSVLQLLRGDIASLIKELLRDYRLPPSSIELEVTESMVMANAEQATAVLHQIKALGVLLAIDDFGTGYSSLVYLKRLPIDTLKIDKEFVGDLTTDPDDEAITATIITMAHSLGLNVVAEGVETLEQLQYLHEQGCDEIQGYWLSRPIEESDCINFLQHHDGDLLMASAGLRLPAER